MKEYKVSLICQWDTVVTAESEEEALDIAYDTVSNYPHMDWELYEIKEF